ncbi:ABC1 family kinase-like protein [Thermosynechococcus sp. NK55a]|jgi:predicted unusual protein kinase regulating ubiquinone biosynthesis (AarF/ABC1/UbiB family)|uniref:ABC1 kinase family protein n=1 Tax=unclassified Thermosynechococcus TaxID=2622553 RepID=UPI0003D86A01|nr:MULTISPECIES: AarF/ABC1/UbiB kinase family protein [unclassified Thermosynechococcus]AHB89499.1 ABC1 family kinase-like protein [Thermosynechococcus sp. NK55a]HIK22403.1 AarF/ABC1/UbiB kinase family protein [Thermosynechococcus sp. M3746_W2019_013]
MNTAIVPSDAAPQEIAIAAETLPNDPESFQPYDPLAIDAYYRQRPLLVLSRWLRILWPVFWLLFNRWWDRVTGQSKQNQQRRAIALRETLTRLGPAYIKVGQALSTRPDLLPAVYLEELTKLQDQLPPFPNEVAFQFIEEELGAPPSELFAELSDHPIAAASLGQVYRGKLHSGEEVAVKVQRPGLAESITLDIYILRGVAYWAKRLIKEIRSDLVAILDEFASRLFEEMDYTQEGRNAERFARLYGHLTDVYVPKIYWQYTRRRVLTMEWVTGVKLNQLQQIQALGIDPRYMVYVGVQCSLRQLLEHGFFHADPHPGNLLAMPSGKLAYLDFGMMSEIAPEQRYGLLNAIVHIVNREYESLAYDYVHLGFLTPDTDLEPIIPALALVFEDALGASVSELNIQRIFDRLSEVMYEYPFQVPAYYALIVRSLLTMEGIAMGVDPNFKVLSAAYPYIAKRLLTDPAPELRTSLTNLLLKDGQFRWTRLENLLRNARESRDYDFNVVLEQALDFLFSERGAEYRDRLADEIVKSLDTWARTTMGQWNLVQLLPLVSRPVPATASSNIISEANALEHLRRIFSILQDTPGFDWVKVIPAILRIIVRPEVQQMGQRIVNGLLQRAIARFIREMLLADSQPALQTTSLSR